MAEQQQFYLLLGNLMSPDNNVRKHSEVSGRDFVGGFLTPGDDELRLGRVSARWPR